MYALLKKFAYYGIMTLNVGLLPEGSVLMWVSVDSIEGRTVILCGDDDKEYTVTAEDYAFLCGRSPRESDMLTATVDEGGSITSLAYSEEETVRRTEAARARLRRLFDRK